MADVGEQNGETAFFGDAGRRVCLQLAGDQRNVVIIQHQSAQGDVAGDMSLAGQADVGAEVAQAGHGLFGGGARRTVVQAVHNQHPTGGAAGVAAANMGVRNGMRQRGIEDGAVIRNLDHAIVVALVGELGHGGGARETVSTV